MANGDLKILSSCKRLIGEIQGYCWDPKASEKGYDTPIKRADHLLDSVRYAIYSYFGNKLYLNSPQEEMTDAKTLGYGMINGQNVFPYQGSRLIQKKNL